MITIDYSKKSTLKDFLLMLTQTEARDLRDALSELLDSRIGESHIHINNASYSKELTVMLYKPDDNPEKYGLSELVFNLSTQNGKFVDD